MEDNETKSLIRVVQVRIASSLWEALGPIAYREGMTRSQWIRAAIDDKLRQLPPSNDPLKAA